MSRGITDIAKEAGEKIRARLVSNDPEHEARPYLVFDINEYLDADDLQRLKEMIQTTRSTELTWGRGFVVLRKFIVDKASNGWLLALVAQNKESAQSYKLEAESPLMKGDVYIRYDTPE